MTHYIFKAPTNNCSENLNSKIKFKLGLFFQHILVAHRDIIKVQMKRHIDSFFRHDSKVNENVLSKLLRTKKSEQLCERREVCTVKR